MSSRVLNLLLTHQDAAQIGAMLRWWQTAVPTAAVLLAVSRAADGEAAEELPGVEHLPKLRVNDPRLRTSDHVRERQSYTGLFSAVSRWLADRPEFDFVHFVEFDQVPLVADLNERQRALLAQEQADVLGFGVRRVDGTSQSVWLSYASEAQRWSDYFGALGVRADPGVVLSMFGSGSFWTRAAFEAVASVPEPFPVYLELWLPTVAHHLGYRVRPYPRGPASDFISNLGNRAGTIDAARLAGAWSIHPVKTLWDDHADGQPVTESPRSVR